MAISLLSHLLLTSSISAGGCDMWGLLVASTGLAGLVLDPWYHHFSNTVLAWFSHRRKGRLANWEKFGRRGIGLNSWMVQLPGSQQGWEEGPA